MESGEPVESMGSEKQRWVGADMWAPCVRRGIEKDFF
jgi:hypothetical protein